MADDAQSADLTSYADVRDHVSPYSPAVSPSYFATWYAYGGSQFPASPYPHNSPSDDDDASLYWAVFLSWTVIVLVIYTLYFTRQYLYEQPLEARRVKEIEELIGEHEHPWKAAEGSSTTDELVTTCSLCLEPYSEGDRVLKLPCGHSYHTDCVRPWFDSTQCKARSCPTCRQNPLISDAEFAQVDLEKREGDGARRAEEAGTPILPSFSSWEAIEPNGTNRIPTFNEWPRPPPLGTGSFIGSLFEHQAWHLMNSINARAYHSMPGAPPRDETISMV